MGSSRAELLQDLARQIRAIEAGQRPPGRPLPLGIAPLDELFLDHGVPAGSLVELFSAEPGAGAFSLALGMARQAIVAQTVAPVDPVAQVAQVAQRAVVIVDEQRCFYPPAAARLGLDLAHTLVIRPRKQQALPVINQALRCPGVGVVLATCTAIPTRAFRQLQLAAETGGGVGFLLRPATASRLGDDLGDDLGEASPSFARLRLRITPIASLQTPRRIRLEVIRCRGNLSPNLSPRLSPRSSLSNEGQSWLLEIDDATSAVRVLPEVAAATAVRGLARASG